MRNLMKLIVITALTALLLTAVLSCAAADERIYTSPVFRLPADRVTGWINAQQEDQDTPEDDKIPEEKTAEDAVPDEKPEEKPAEDAIPEEKPVKDDVPEEKPAEDAVPDEKPAEDAVPDEKPASDEPVKESDPDIPEEEKTEGQPAGDQGTEEQGTGEQGTEEPTPQVQVREVRIYSSQTEIVTEGEIIYLTSELKGFDGLEVTYQWEVDRGDGLGWVPVEGATRSKHMFVASRETIRYTWRLIVNVDE